MCIRDSYHDSSNSYIVDNGTGDLIIYGANLRLGAAGTGEQFIRCYSNGAVELYYDNSLKLSTAGGGVSVSGQLSATTASLNNGVGNGSGAELNLNGSGDIQTKTGGSLFFGAYDYSASTYIRGHDSSTGLQFFSNGSNVMNITSSTVTATSLTVSGNINVGEKIAHDGDSNTYMQLTTDQINFYAGNVRMLTLQESTHDQIVINENGADVNFRIESNLEANAFYIDGAGSGSVGIGTSTPNAKLEVNGTIAHKVYTVSALPSASPAGQRAFVSDSYYSLQASHGSGVSGGGSNFTPVYSDGSNWFNG